MLLVYLFQGTTGSPKGATLSHHNIVNNAYFLGLRMGYGSRVSPYLSPDLKKTQTVKRKSSCFPYSHQPQVRVCVPVPMHHCFGSVMGGMSMAVHGITLVFPSQGYNSRANLEAIQSEKYSTLITQMTCKYTTLCTLIDFHSCCFTQGAMLSTALPQCSPTCSANRIYTSMICRHLKLVRDLKTKT